MGSFSKRAGAQAACAYFGIKEAALTPRAKDLAELVGLGLIAAPTVHSLTSEGSKESPGLTKAKHVSDLTGLAVLSAPTVMDLLQKAH